MAVADPAALSAEIHVPSFRLNGDAVSAKLAASITDGTVETTIEGASTLSLELHDQDDELHRLIAGGLFTVPIIRKGHKRDPARPILPSLRQGTKLRALEMDWEMVHLSKTDVGTYSATFEDHRVCALRRLDRPRKMARDKHTRAEFIKAITVKELRRPRIIFDAHGELHVKQEIARLHSPTTRESSGPVNQHGEDSGLESLNRRFPRHSLADASGHFQMTERGARMCAEAAGFRPAVALQMAQIARGESTYFPGIVSWDGGWGLWQMTPVAGGWGAEALRKLASLGGIEAMLNPVKCALMAKWLYDQSGLGPWRGTRYLEDEQQNVESVLGPGSMSTADSTGRTVTETKKYEFSRGRPGGPKGEDSWAAGQRLAGEVGWRLFMVRDVLHFIHEEDLIATRPRVRLVEGQRGCEKIAYEVDSGRAVNEATVTARSKLWLAPPGAVVTIDGEGPADGRWLVASVRRGLFDLETEIQLRRNRALLPEKKEPAPETSTRTRPDPGGGTSDDSDGLQVNASMSPKDVIDKFILPIAQGHGCTDTAATVEAANAVHGPTTRGTRSEHQGPPSQAWAADLHGPNLGVIAWAIAQHIGAPNGGAGSFVRTIFEGWSFQLLWQVEDHYDHVHCGVHRA